MNATECTNQLYLFQPQNRREVSARFDGGMLTSDAGCLLLREVEKRSGILRRFASCFQDFRDPRFTIYSIEELVSQRVYGLVCGHEDLNDHERGDMENRIKEQFSLSLLLGLPSAAAADRVRRIYFSFVSGFPYQHLCHAAYVKLTQT